MKRLNNKGFTLIEVLAVVVILGTLLAIIAPNTTKIITKNKTDNLEKIETSITTAAKMFISDYKYQISVGGTCSDPSSKLKIISIKTETETLTLGDSKIKISTLVDEGYLTTNIDGNIYNPANKEQKLNLDNSYIIVEFDCSKKEYLYKEPELRWE